PSSTLFPYTTLFRSWVAQGDLELESGQGTEKATFTTDVPGTHRVRVLLHYGDCNILRDFIVTKHYEPKMSIEAVCDINNATYDVDRKSTRLNSSHVK